MNDIRRWQLLALVLLLGWLLWLLAPVLTPFALAALLAYLGDPVADRLEAWKLSRTAAVTVVFAVMSLAVVGSLLLLVPLLEGQISKLIRQLPVVIAWFNESLLPWMKVQFGLEAEVISAERILGLVREHWQAAGGLVSAVLGSVSRSGAWVFALLMNLVLVPVVTFYLLRDWDLLMARLRTLLPRDIEPVVLRLARDADNVLGAFLRGQMSVMLLLGLYYTIGLWLVGVDLALLIGMGAGLVSFVPYLGTIVGVGAGVIATLIQHGDLTHLVLVLAVFVIGQLLEGMLLTPWLVGDRIGLHPVAVIFAVLAGGQLFGFLGILLALPVAAVAMVLLRYLHEQYEKSHLYAAEPAIAAPAPPPPPVPRPPRRRAPAKPAAAASAVKPAAPKPAPRSRRRKNPPSEGDHGPG